MSGLMSNAEVREIGVSETGFVRRPDPDGAAVAYRTYGRARPGVADVVLVHGSLQNSAVWSKHGYIAQLSQQYRVTTIDVRGHGASEKPDHPGGYAIASSVRDVCAVLDHLGIHRTHYIGYSLGGRIGLTLAATAPERLTSLVVAGSSHRPQRGAVDVLIFPDAVRVVEESGLAAFVAGWEAHRDQQMGSGFRATIEALGQRGLAALLRQWDAEPGVAEEVLLQIETPTLFFAGSEDPMRLAESREAAVRMPRAYFALLDGCNHGQTVTMRERILDRAEAFFRLSEFSDIEKLRVAG
ncbi:alpha/beta fold hydrolase [Mycobacteroides salmoniphilum]|uniref:alpha/beta fold hydrolase n=1 Tax=Mycobacteroides salmoniphilum TaxID=404941 RepID=UPI003561ACBF